MDRLYEIKDGDTILGEVRFRCNDLPNKRYIKFDEYMSFLQKRFNENMVFKYYDFAHNKKGSRLSYLTLLYDSAMQVKCLIWSKFGMEEAKKVKLVESKSSDGFILEYNKKEVDLDNKIIQETILRLLGVL